MQCDECGQWRRVPYKMWLENEQPSVAAAGGAAGADCIDTYKSSRKRKGKRWTCDHIDPGGCQSLCVRADKKWRYGALDDRRHVARLEDLSRRQREQLAQQPPNCSSRELQPCRPQSDDCKAQGDDAEDSPGGAAVLQSSSNEAENSMLNLHQDILMGQDTSGPDDSRAATNDRVGAEADAPPADSATPTFSLPAPGDSTAEALDSHEHQDALSKQEADMPPPAPPAPAAAASEDMMMGADIGDMHQTEDSIVHAHDGDRRDPRGPQEKLLLVFSSRLETTEP